MLYFVGVGPGDPELITMKAVRILQEADMIVLPDTFDAAKISPKTNAVLMKSGKSISALKESIPGGYVVRNLGMSGQWLGKLADYPEDRISYFTTVIVKP